ncbi:2'%2C3'-cyclic-nucleotide 2'-phosphodiesterase/3'-nucleotidase precursor [Bordetella ansorpii]|uniref:2',3'-cyclic-nucleotide 2'-phosphodiesterase/3'-nucleotidase n=1 Tax=Bordetella ansorpii TaxID=288768 RepID=A0A157SC58_9BORD|nr:bifunctional 2',3'-cyclic-nucleotide 2'-phosphodiesterase/3'-nucleotidase [Bordetella ansorpii]SAI68022.1 2'%2C3'-cyclic-nucleotide 2'-phosphodiesterase/3'-nucleotidase precursor [Bordetella ansorpii]
MASPASTFDPRKIRPRARHAALAVAMACTLAACGGHDDDDDDTSTPPVVEQKPATAELAVLSTSDLHYNARSYDYFKLAEDKTYGFERTATLIRDARKEFANTLLVDNGDTIQGTALADYEATVDPIPCSQQLTMYKAMSELNFDAGTVGNHEFNYGLPFLNQVLGGGMDVDGVDGSLKCAGPGFPVTVANVTSVKSGQPLLQPYVILDREIDATQEDGAKVKLPIKVGIVGVTTPGIMNWDKRYLDGKVEVQDGVASAEKYVAEARANGADLVFVLLHGGMDATQSPMMENPGRFVAEVEGIDGLIMGHQHNIFPDRGASPSYPSDDVVDNTAGTVAGVPAVMPSQWGKAMGVIDYSLKWDGKAWQVDKARTEVDVRTTQYKDAGGATQYVASDSAVVEAVEAQHEAAITYVKEPIGQTDFRMSTLFADVGDPGAIQLVNQAQQAYVKNYIDANLPEYSSIPVLSISAPFKAGFSSATDYTDVAAGDLAIFNAADLYLYPNTVYAVKVTGAQLKLWLENAAKRFNRIDPAATADQWLIKDTKTGKVPSGQSAFAGYNFDMFTTPDLQYEIDVTAAENSRIKNLTYMGNPVDGMDFIVATNNYRAESSAQYILGPGNAFDIVYASPDANRDVVINYIKENPTVTRATNGSSRSWRFTPVTTAGRVLFKTGQDAQSVATAAGLTNVSLTADADDLGEGRAVYQIDLNPVP